MALYESYCVIKKGTHITMKKATKKVAGVSEDFVQEKGAHTIYFGKTFIGGKDIDPDNHKTWGKEGIRDHRIRRKKSKCYKGKEGFDMAVLAVVNENSIPYECRRDRYLIHSEEYAIILTTRLIEYFKKYYPDLLARKDVTPGRRGGEKEAYVVYMAFLESKYDIGWWVMHVQ